MLLRNLVEDTPGSSAGLGWEHGLSFYLETGRHGLLFDVGASALFEQNAATLGIDLKRVDTVIISHGHNDHGGGLRRFLACNRQANVYVQQRAFESHYSSSGGTIHEIGLDRALRTHPQIRFVARNLRIDEELFLFSGVAQRQFWPAANGNLLKREGDTYLPDDFCHEQYLAVDAGGLSLLFSGCGHCGILNILAEYKALLGKAPDMVIGGMHLTSPRTGNCIPPEALEELAQRLAAYPTRFVTCHCTGETPCQILQQALGERFHVIHTGDRIPLR